MRATNTDRRTNVVVLGGGYAGVTAALRLAPCCEVTLVEPREHFVERVRLHQLAAGGRASVTHPFAKLLAGSGVRHLAGRAVSLDPDAGTVGVEAVDGELLDLGYDRLVYALGSRTAVPTRAAAIAPAEPAVAPFARTLAGEHATTLPEVTTMLSQTPVTVFSSTGPGLAADSGVPGRTARTGDSGELDSSGLGTAGNGPQLFTAATAGGLPRTAGNGLQLFTAATAGGLPETTGNGPRLFTAETASGLAAFMAGREGRLAVVGGGLTGIEMASELAEAHSGWEIRLLTSGVLASTLSEAGRAHIRAVLERLGVRIEEGTATLAPDEIDADAVLWSASMTPNTGLAAAAGLELDEHGRIRVDAALRSVSQPAIVVAGDAGAGWRMACATAMPTGAHAAGTILREARGETARPFRLRYVTACISLGRSDALLQLLHSDDRPRDTVLTGRPAVWAKEAIVAGTVGSLRVAARHPSVLGVFGM